MDKKKIVNYLLFQAGWFVTVLSAAAGLVWIAAIYCALLLAVHFGWVMAEHRRREAILIASAVGIGIIGDSAIALAGLLTFASPWPFADWFTPLWMMILWVNFTTTINSSLSWMHGRMGLAILFGITGGASAYLGGHLLGAMVVSSPWWLSYGVIGVYWGIAFPALYVITARLDR